MNIQVTQAVNSVISKLQQSIQINGDGEEKLDFTYIQDLIDGISLCCENSKAINQTFNLTYGESRSIQDLLKILQSEFDGLKISFNEREKFMPERGTLNISKAKITTSNLVFEKFFYSEKKYQYLFIL